MKQTIVIPELPPGLNGKDGLKRMHWAKYRNVRDKWNWLIAAENPDKHGGRVKVHYTRYSTAPMDFDNIGASFKVVGDALESNNVIQDDSPNCLTELVLNWQKSSRKDQRTEIIIEDV